MTLLRACLIASALALLAGCSPGRPEAAGGSPPPAGSAASQLETLGIAALESVADYDRAAFGQRWADVDRNGCDTRNDILARDLTAKELRPGTHGCVVVAGQLVDPYTGDTIEFAKADAGRVQIDHVVALADAWANGASLWNAERRVQFANDPMNLLAVDGAANLSKGDRNAAGWLPPREAYRCRYAARQVTVKAHYQLTVTAEEHDALASVLERCPGERPAR